MNLTHTMRWNAVLGVLSALTLLTLADDLALAGNGVSVPAGTIYAYLNSETIGMDADGSNKTAEAAGVGGVPSKALHGGRRWFLHVGGSPALGRSLFASASDADSNGDLQGELVPLIVPGDDGEWEVAVGNVRWVFDLQAAAAGDDGTDGMASWLAVQRIDGVVVDAAICRAPLRFDLTTGDVTGIDLTAVERFPVSSSDFDWSADGTRIAFAYGKVISTYDLLTDTLTTLPMSNAVQPAWSPDGSKLAFVVSQTTSDAIRTITLVGGIQKTLVSVTRRSDLGMYLRSPVWSPAGAHVAYLKDNWQPGKESADVWRVGVDGKGNINLTADLDTYGVPSGALLLGWK